MRSDLRGSMLGIFYLEFSSVSDHDRNDSLTPAAHTDVKLTQRAVTVASDPLKPCFANIHHAFVHLLVYIAESDRFLQQGSSYDTTESQGQTG